MLPWRHLVLYHETSLSGVDFASHDVKRYRVGRHVETCSNPEEEACVSALESDNSGSEAGPKEPRREGVQPMPSAVLRRGSLESEKAGTSRSLPFIYPGRACVTG